MTRPKQDPKITNKFLGLVNTYDPLSAPKGSLTEADNIDIDDTSAIRRREGFTSTKALTNVQAAYATENQKDLYLIDDGNLLKVGDDFSTVIMASGFPDAEYYFEEVGNKVYVSGPKRGVIYKNEFRPWGVSVPPAPTALLVPGTLPVGQYLLSCVYKNSYGEESAAAAATVVRVLTPSAMRITVPQKADHSTVVYVSATNGETMYKLTETTDHTIEWSGPVSALVAPLPKEQKQTFPVPSDATCLAYMDGKMFVSEYSAANDTSYIFMSKPFWLGLFDLFADYETIAGEVRMLEAFSDGLLIGTDKDVYVFNADRGLTKLVEYGVPKGKPAARDPEGVVYFWTERGVCRVPEFANLTQELASVPAGDKCYAAFIEQQGYNRFLISTTDGGLENNQYS